VYCQNVQISAFLCFPHSQNNWKPCLIKSLNVRLAKTWNPAPSVCSMALTIYPPPPHPHIFTWLNWGENFPPLFPLLCGRSLDSQIWHTKSECRQKDHQYSLAFEWFYGFTVVSPSSLATISPLHHPQEKVGLLIWLFSRSLGCLKSLTDFPLSALATGRSPDSLPDYHENHYI
jgi:hypothetical protein